MHGRCIYELLTKGCHAVSCPECFISLMCRSSMRCCYSNVVTCNILPGVVPIEIAVLGNHNFLPQFEGNSFKEYENLRCTSLGSIFPRLEGASFRVNRQTCHHTTA